MISIIIPTYNRQDLLLSTLKSLLAQDGVVQGGHRTAVMEDLIAISSLQDYFITIENLGNTPDTEDEE